MNFADKISQIQTMLSAAVETGQCLKGTNIKSPIFEVQPAVFTDGFVLQPVNQTFSLLG